MTRRAGDWSRAAALAAAAWLLALICGGCAHDPVPRHLELVRSLERDVPAERTTYQHSPTEVVWTGRAACYADCSGLVNEAMKRSLSLDGAGLSAWLKRDRPLAVDYFRAISEGRGFERVESLGDVRPGDVIAIRYERGSGNSGHVMIVDREPRPVPGRPPTVPGTTQWLVAVIDCSSTGHGPGDTRWNDHAKVRTGLGRGDLRVYLDGSGAIAGHTFTTEESAPFREQGARPLAIGRPMRPPARPRRAPARRRGGRRREGRRPAPHRGTNAIRERW